MEGTKRKTKKDPAKKWCDCKYAIRRHQVELEKSLESPVSTNIVRTLENLIAKITTTEL